MTSSKNWLHMAAPAGWGDVLVRALKVAVVAFVIFHLKEWMDAGRFDTLDILIDSAWVAAGAFVLDAVLMWAGS